MSKNVLIAAAIALSVGMSSLQAAAQEGASQAPQTPNWFDPSTWAGAMPAGAPGQPTDPSAGFNWFDPRMWTGMPGSQPGPAPRFNLAQPGGWATFMNPGTYPYLMNPATYAQFMSPQFYMQFADPNNWMTWMNPAAYAPWFNPATYMQWMNPAAYGQFMNPMTYMQWMNPASYMAFMNPALYMQWMNPAAYAMPGTQPGVAGAYNWFDPNTWTQMWSQPTAPAPEPGPTQ